MKILSSIISKKRAEREREERKKRQRQKEERTRTGQGRTKYSLKRKSEGESCPYYPSSYYEQHLPLRNREGINTGIMLETNTRATVMEHCARQTSTISSPRPVIIN